MRVLTHVWNVENGFVGLISCFQNEKFLGLNFALRQPGSAPDLNQLIAVVNSFHAISLFLYPRKTPENQKFFEVFREYRKKLVTWNRLTLEAPTPQKGQTHSNNSSDVANELFECVWTFCRFGAWKVNRWVRLTLPYRFRMVFSSQVTDEEDKFIWHRNYLTFYTCFDH